jgi:hypothetical protein
MRRVGSNSSLNSFRLPYASLIIAFRGIEYLQARVMGTSRSMQLCSCWAHVGKATVVSNNDASNGILFAKLSLCGTTTLPVFSASPTKDARHQRGLTGHDDESILYYRSAFDMRLRKRKVRRLNGGA